MAKHYLKTSSALIQAEYNTLLLMNFYPAIAFNNA